MKVALVLLLAVACDREIRRPLRGGDERPASATPNVTLFPGDKPIEGGELDLSLPGYRETAQNVSDGKKLYAMFNCVGCHANGGGAMGPAFIDDRWIYGSAPDEVATSIIAGRPDGMPSYRGKLVPAQLYQLIAYVRSLGGLVRSDARSARSDHMQALPPPTLRDLAIPQPSKDRP